jgi:hypothetical protein
MTYPKDVIEISLHKDDRDEILVESDTLIAFLSGFRAVVSQKMSKPFRKMTWSLEGESGIFIRMIG